MNDCCSDVDDRFIQTARTLSIRSPIICDIGSRDAREGITLLRQLGGKELHIFEPNPLAAEICRKYLALLGSEEQKLIFFNEIAVSDKEGTAQFYSVDMNASANKDIGFSSLMKINPRYIRNRESIVQKEITVSTIDLDRYFRNRASPDVLWIDAEGAELSILRGAQSVLPDVRLIQVELSFRPMQIDKPLFWEIDQYLNRFGFHLAFFVELSPLLGFLYRRRLLPNPPWRVNAVYCRKN